MYQGFPVFEPLEILTYDEKKEGKLEIPKDFHCCKKSEIPEREKAIQAMHSRPFL